VSRRLNPSRSGLRVNSHRFHQGQVDQEIVIAHGASGDVVATAAYRQEQLLLTRKLHCLDDIGNILAAHHKGGMPSIIAFQMVRAAS
jgi:hypothetical protein